MLLSFTFFLYKKIDIISFLLHIKILINNLNINFDLFWLIKNKNNYRNIIITIMNSFWKFLTICFK